MVLLLHPVPTDHHFSQAAFMIAHARKRQQTKPECLMLKLSACKLQLCFWLACSVQKYSCLKAWAARNMSYLTGRTGPQWGRCSHSACRSCTGDGIANTLPQLNTLDLCSCKSENCIDPTSIATRILANLSWPNACLGAESIYVYIYMCIYIYIPIRICRNI